MRRRQFIRILAASAACAIAAPALARRRPLRVGVAGGGIVGAAIAMQLAEGGAQVLLFEKQAPAAGATRNSFAWLNAFVNDHHYRALRLRSLAAYHALDQRLGLGITWGGYLNWASDAAGVATVRANAAQLAGTAEPARALTAAEFAALCPGLRPRPIAAAIYSPGDGHLDPVRATECFLRAARLRGAQTVFPCELQSLRFRRGRLAGAGTSIGWMPLDRLVVAAGVDTPGILAMAGHALRLRHAPGFLLHSTPLAAQLHSVCDAPGGLEFKQMADGTLVGTDSPEPPDTPAHAAIRAHALDFPDAALRAWHGARVLGKIGALLPAARDAAVDHVTLGFRPMPTDGFPVVGPVPEAPDVYAVVTHSGVTLAPLLGEYVRMELLGAQPVDMLAPYRPARFAA